MKLHAVNEWSHLQKVVVGTAQSMGGTPSVDAAYDPKSKEHIHEQIIKTLETRLSERKSF